MADPGYGWAEHGKPRREWGLLLRESPVVCSYRGCEVCGRAACGRMVYADAALNWDRKPWHLGHGVSLKHGGDGSDSSPQHQTCNLRDAACLTNHGETGTVVVAYDW